jgi:hypothetical protein
MSKELDKMLGEHQSKFKVKSWKNYTDEELKWWIKLLRKRAEHRVDEEKKYKDLKDASNYELMLSESEKYALKDSEQYRSVDLTDDKLAILKNYAVFIKVKNENYLEILLGRDNVQEIFDALLGDRK